MYQSGRVWHLELMFEGTGLTADSARQEAMNYVPADAQRVETYSPRQMPELSVELFMSESLAKRFEDDLFTGGVPGNFVIVYALHDGRTTRAVIGLGNSP